MVSPSSRRKAVRHLVTRFRVSERQACRLLEQHRSTNRYAALPPDYEVRLVKRMNQLAQEHPRWGYRMVSSLLKSEGWPINRKRVERLWRLEGNRVPPRRSKASGRRAEGASDNAAWNLPAQRPNHIWSFDFMSARTRRGGPIRILNTQDDGLGNPTTYLYDPLNRQTSVTDPLNRASALTYDAAGRVLTKVDAMNRTTTFTYDVNGQLASATYSDGVTPNVGYTYNGIGQRLTMTDGTGTTTYTYDSLHRVKTVTNGAGNRVGYGYDLQGQVTSITSPSTTGSVTRSYDDAGRVHQISDWLGHTTTYNYHPDGALISMTYPNGTTAAFGTDNADRLTSIVDSLNGTPFLNLPLARDNVGQLTTQASDTYSNDVVNRLHVWTNPAAAVTTYQYDAADQLKNSTITAGNQSAFNYDIANQIQSLTVTDTNSNPVASYSYNFNANGNRIQMNGLGGGGPPTTTYAYDQANRLVNFNSVATYGYSGDAIRMSKTAGGTTTQYTWESIDGIAQMLQDGTTSYVTGVGGHPLEQIKADGTVYYYHQDQIGSTRALTDSAELAGDRDQGVRCGSAACTGLLRRRRRYGPERKVATSGHGP